jgi:hypothetical protein
MKAENPAKAGTFLQRTSYILEKDEVRGNLIYGLANTLAKNEH